MNAMQFTINQRSIEGHIMDLCFDLAEFWLGMLHTEEIVTENMAIDPHSETTRVNVLRYHDYRNKYNDTKRILANYPKELVERYTV